MKSILSALITLLLIVANHQSVAQTQANMEYEKAVQLVLKTYGYEPGPIDGTIGIQTSSALVKFQRDMGIAITGSADAATAKAMIDLLNSSPPKERETTPSFGSTWSWSQPEDQTDLITSPRLPVFQGATTPPVIVGNKGEYLGSFNANRYDPNSVSNPYGQYGSQYSPKSINNPYGQYGSQYSPDGVTNPYTTGGPKLFGSDGKYLGRVNSNQYDPESISNPYGIYGSKYNPTSVNNPYSIYGSPYSPQSATNPYSTSSQPLFDWDK